MDSPLMESERETLMAIWRLIAHPQHDVADGARITEASGKEPALGLGVARFGVQSANLSSDGGAAPG